MAKIFTPVKGYNGISATVKFTNGVGQCDDPFLLQWFRAKGYRVEEPVEVIEVIETPVEVSLVEETPEVETIEFETVEIKLEPTENGAKVLELLKDPKPVVTVKKKPVGGK